MDGIEHRIKSAQSIHKAVLDWAEKHVTGEWLDEICKECQKNQLTLKRVEFANEFNPSVAVFGEYQVGKSYLVDELLSTDRGPLTIYDGNGKGYGFIESINPIGGGKASTSLISRFTINRYSDNPEFPFCCVMLSPVDIVLILCDTYYNDVKNQQFPAKEQIAEKVKWIKEHYYDKAEVQSYIRYVDILEIKDYFKNTSFNKAESFVYNLMATDFFETLSECIQSIGVSEWRSVFEFLWNGNKPISDLFDKLFATLETLDFPKKCYINIDPLLRKDGTILELDRIYELLDLEEVINLGRIVSVNKAKVKDMEVWNGQKVVSVPKSVFCALTAEVALTISDDDSGSDSELLREKPFLDYLDVLDFPGFNRRMLMDDNCITQWEICRMFISGKTLYLLNKYSKQYLISNLMLCHHDMKSDVYTMWCLLKDWIHSSVGRSPEERAEYIRSSEISPLFIVSTKFNADLVKQPIDCLGSDEEKEQVKRARWIKRFNSTLGDLLHEPYDDLWLSQWTPDKPFKNMYLLRNFVYSCQSGVYEGYLKRDERGNWIDNYVDGHRREERISDAYKDFIPELKRTFLENDFVQTHFEDPEKSWDEAVSLNHNGSAWIIENLTKAAKNAYVARERKFDRLLHGNAEGLLYWVNRHISDTTLLQLIEHLKYSNIEE